MTASEKPCSDCARLRAELALKQDQLDLAMDLVGAVAAHDVVSSPLHDALIRANQRLAEVKRDQTGGTVIVRSDSPMWRGKPT